MKRKYWVVSKKWKRHGKYSGYEQLIQYTSSYHIKPFRVFHTINTYFKRKAKLVNYSSLAFSKELGILLKIPSGKKIHVFYGDMDYFYLQILKRCFLFRFLKNELIATFHHPPEELEKRFQYNRSKTLGALDKIIVMGRNQIPFFERYTSAKINFIPHGIDINFFKPNLKLTRKNQILVIGISHRDHGLTRMIIKKAGRKYENLDFLVIVPKEFDKYYKDLTNVNLNTVKLNDNDLLYNYQTSKGVLLMLNNCTASNTLLEALATGCPLIVNTVGAVEDYVPPQSGIPLFQNNDQEGIVEYIGALCRDEKKAGEISRLQVELAKQFDWVKVANTTSKFIAG